VRILPLPLAFLVLLAMWKRGRPTTGFDPRSDEQLYREYGTGDEHAFRVLLDRHGSGVYRYLTRYLGDEEMARDVTQDAFVRVITGADGFRGQSSFRTYLFTLVRHAAIDAVRTRGRRPDLRGGGAFDGPDDRLPGDPWLVQRMSVADHAHQRTLSGELSEALEVGLAQLPSEQREAFLLREAEGLTFPEIGAIQGVNLETARSRVGYAVKSLRRSLAGFGGQP